MGLGSIRFAIDTLFLPEAVLSKRGKGIRITTSHCLLRTLLASLQSGRDWLSDVKVVVCEDLQLLDAVYEFAISVLIHETQTLPVRFIGLAYCLNDPTNLAEWLHVPSQTLFSFRARDREQSLVVKVVSFTIPHSAALFKTMAKPAYSAITEAPPDENVLLYVPSRSQCQNVAGDLITQCAIDLNTRGFLGQGTSAEDLQPYLARLQNPSLSDFISRGIGIFHEGVPRADLTLMLQLYLEGILRVLVTPRESCWTVPVRAGVVVVMGTQYIRMASESDRQIQEYSVQEVAKMQASAIRPDRTGAFHLFCQAEQRDTYMRFLNEGLPLESTLADSDEIKNWMGEIRKAGSVRGKQDALDVLSFTYMSRRVESNPTYYDTLIGHRAEYMSRLVDRIWSSEN